MKKDTVIKTGYADGYIYINKIDTQFNGDKYITNTIQKDDFILEISENSDNKYKFSIKVISKDKSNCIVILNSELSIVKHIDSSTGCQRLDDSTIAKYLDLNNRIISSIK